MYIFPNGGRKKLIALPWLFTDIRCKKAHVCIHMGIDLFTEDIIILGMGCVLLSTL